MIHSKGRLGAQDVGGYPSIKGHPFFEAVDFETLHLREPPRPRNFADVVDSNQMENDYEFDNVEPGLGGAQLSRLLGLQLNDEASGSVPIQESSSPTTPSSSQDAATSSSPSSSAAAKAKTSVQFPANDQQLRARLLQQQETIPQWHALVDKQLILKQGLIDKKMVKDLSSKLSVLFKRIISFI